MEIKIRLPRFSFELRREPVSQDRFEAICWLIGIFLVGSGVLKFFALMAGA